MAAPLKRKSERREYDTYETPVWAVEALLEVIPIDMKKKYMEPCRASGRIYNFLPIGSAWGEIRQGVDYLTTEYNHTDIIISNPPYSLAQEFVEKALRDADVVIMLLRLGFLESMKRWEWWQDNPPTSLLVLSQRPSFTEDGKTDGSGYAWYVWDKKNTLNLKPFYFLRGKDGKCRQQNERDSEQVEKGHPKISGGTVRPDSKRDQPVCKERSIWNGYVTTVPRGNG